MFLAATPEVQVETAGSDVSYTFPPRPLGLLRWIGLFFVGFSVLFVWSPAGTLIGTFRKLFSGSELHGFEFVPLIGELIFVVAGCFPGVLGLLIAFGRCRVDWRDERLSVVDYVGPIRWRRRFPKSPLRKFTVGFGAAEVDDQPVKTGPMATLGVLAADFESGERRMILLGYPRDWLHDLARDLSMRVGSSVAAAAVPQVEVVNKLVDQPNLEDAPKPADTCINIESRVSGLSIEIPPAGLGKSNGLFGMSVVWCLVMALFTAMPLLNGAKTSSGFWLAIPWFWLIGLALMIGAVRVGRRRTSLVVESGKLSMTQTDPFGTKHREWQRGEISAIRADASEMKSNHRWIIELQIHPVAGKKVGMLAGRKDDELRWLATELRRALNAPAQKP
jgi:hypothetical protein